MELTEKKDVIKKETITYSGRTLKEICECAQEEFYKANGYYPTPEQAVELTNEARREIAEEREKAKNIAPE